MGELKEGVSLPLRVPPDSRTKWSPRLPQRPDNQWDHSLWGMILVPEGAGHYHWPGPLAASRGGEISANGMIKSLAHQSALRW